MKTSSIQITPEILAMIAEIDEFKGAWRSLGTLAPERLKAEHTQINLHVVGGERSSCASGRRTLNMVRSSLMHAKERR